MGLNSERSRFDPFTPKLFSAGYLAKRFAPILSLNEKFALIVLLVWVILYGARPFHLGLYHDDWWALIEGTQGTAPFSLERLGHFVGSNSDYPARPVAGFAAYLLTSFCGRSPIAYQVCLAILALLAALSLRAWFVALLSRSFRVQSIFVADLATAFWLSVPWSVATTGWPMCAAAFLPSLILFTQAARVPLAAGGTTLMRLLWYGFLLLASYLSYETFYFQFILLSSLYLLVYKEVFARKIHILAFVVAGLGTQVVSIIVNRVVAGSHGKASKTFAAGWPDIFVNSFREAPGEMMQVLGAAAALWIILALVLVTAAVVTILIVGELPLERRSIWRPIALVGFGIAMIPLGVAVYASAGYRITASGLGSRTLASVSLELSILFLALISTVMLSQSKLFKLIALAAGVFLILINGVAQRNQVSLYATVWAKEQAVLREAPTSWLRSLPPGSRVLYVGPSYYRDIVVFGADWDITGAVFSLPELREGRSAKRGLTMINAATDMYNWTWDGSNLIQDCPGYFTNAFKATRLFVWDYDAHRVYQADKGFHRVFSPGGSGKPASTIAASAEFHGIDTGTRGNWKEMYGGDGFMIAADAESLPGYAQVILGGQNAIAWAPSTNDVRAPKRKAGQDRLAGAWWSSSTFQVKIELTDGKPHGVALYFLDWERSGRAETLDVVDPRTGRVLDSRPVQNFGEGQYLIWKLSGNVVMRITRTGGLNAVLSAIYFQ